MGSDVDSDRYRGEAELAGQPGPVPEDPTDNGENRLSPEVLHSTDVNAAPEPEPAVCPPESPPPGPPPSLPPPSSLQSATRQPAEAEADRSLPGPEVEPGAVTPSGAHLDSQPLAETRGASGAAGSPAPASLAAAAPSLPMPGLPDPDAADDDTGEVAFEIADLQGPVRAERTDERRIAAGSRCKGTIVAVNESAVIVSFGAKVEGQVPIEEFRDVGGNVTADVGQQIEVFVERLAAPGEYATLSFQRVREEAAWNAVEAAHADHEPVPAKIVEEIRGGLRVDIGVSAFLPRSQIDIRPVRNLAEWIGKTVEVVVLECNRRRFNAVVSRRELLKAARERQVAATMERLKVGEPATGVIKNITSYGVFVDLGGIDGLIKLTELSYGRVENPANILEPGQEVTAMVLRIDTDRERVALSLRAMRPDPWLTIEERFKPGDRIQGRVTSVTDYGAFVEIEAGVEGLIHISEMEWSQRPKHPSKTFSPGAETEAVVLDVKPGERRISLSFRQLVPDPWDQYAASLEPGSVVEGVVRRIVDFGLFVEIAEGFEGLVHVSDLSWDTHSRKPHEFARKGQTINTVILNVDVENRRLSLGVKQLEPDSWDAFLSQSAVGDSVPGLVRRLVKFGAFVELAPGVEGLCHRTRCPRGKPGLQQGRRYRFEILDVNERARRIGLRCMRADPLDDEHASAREPECGEAPSEPPNGVS